MGYESWIKIEHTTPDKQELHRMAELLNIDVDAVFGKAMRFWIWADQNTGDGRTCVSSLAQIDRLTFCKGFGQAMIEVGWLVNDSGSLVIPKFDRHNSDSAKKRARNLRDKVASRLRHQSVTKLSPHEEEKNMTSSLSMSSSMSASEIEDGEKSSSEYFVGPVSARIQEPLPDPLSDFEPETASKARHFWGLFCQHYHGKVMLRNLHSDATHKELRHFAKAIHTHSDKAVKTLTEYYANPPREDKALNAYQIVCKLGLNASANLPPPWEANKQKNEDDGRKRMHEAIRNLGLPKG